ncbi:hypothetical protein AC579_5149 [Pseudocercospora musae]|uniref:Uncharacterized protein n=1 Tax=Pseudocercospora musae TaxID=113226 RepID=A0A139INX7_9PEZI|nr:hypothetical protein AC579_5149 [Pseudocercospora musae]
MASIRATGTPVVRRKHQHNSAFVLAPKTWTGPDAVPLGARRPVVEDASEARFPDSQEGPLPASWCTNVGPQWAPVALAADMLQLARKIGASARSAEGVNKSERGNNHAVVDNAIAAMPSDKAQGKQRAVEPEPEPEPTPASQLERAKQRKQDLGDGT